jgi:hypothetical protein
VPLDVRELPLWNAREPERNFAPLPKSRVKSYFPAKQCIEIECGSEGGTQMPDPANDSNRPQPNPNEKLTKVFDSENDSEALVVKGLLDSAGIDNDLTSAAMIDDMFPGLGGMIILVRQEDADEARRVISEYRRSSPDDDETAEIEITEEPPPKR